MSATAQLALPFVFTTRYDPAAFLPDDSNAEARQWLRADWPSGRLAIWGAAGCGKTHLLHAWAARAEAKLGAAWDPGAPPRAIAVDDANSLPEEVLLHLLNSAAEAGTRVLLAAREAPARWPTRLPDLASRLRATAAVRIAAAGDALLRALLARLLAQRQLVVGQDMQDWLLLRLPRHPAALRAAAARLDEAALASGAGVTRALADRVIASVAVEEG